MMNTVNSDLMHLSIPITATDRMAIEAFTRSIDQSESSAAQQYRNALAVLVVHRYLQLLSIESDLDHSSSRIDGQKAAVDADSDAADLFVPEAKGRLECRSVHSGEDHCLIPESVWRDRLGFVIVQLDEPYREGVILGFIRQVSTRKLPISLLQPLDDLIDCLIPESISEICLSQWLKGAFESAWQPIESLLKPAIAPLVLFANLSPAASTQNISALVKQLYTKANLNISTPISAIDRDPEAALAQLVQTAQSDEIRWQAAELLAEINPQHPAGAVRSARDLGLYLAGHAIALMVGILQKSDGRRLILARVYPLQQEPHLPSGLRLRGFDQSETCFFDLQSRERDDSMQFKFTADPGDRFSLSVSLDAAAVSESFVV